jgi:hypothetical protein
MAVTQSLTLREVSTDIHANTSVVEIVWTSTQTGDSWNGYEKIAYYYVSINGGDEQTNATYYILRKNSTDTIVSERITVKHREDGTGTVKVRTWMDTDISAGVIEKTKTLTLTTISRATTKVYAYDVTLGEACDVSWTPLSSEFTYKLNFSIGDWSHTTGVIEPERTTSYWYSRYTIPLDVANQLPNQKEGTMKVTLATYSDKYGKNQVGSDAITYFKILVPNNEATQPTVSMSLSPISNLPSPFNNLYIQGHSKVKASLEFGTRYGATVEASNITVNGNAYASPYESDVLSQTGKVTVKATVKDSRGYYGTNYKDIEVIPYQKPYCVAKSNENSIIVGRCDSSANFTDSGTYLKIKAKIVYSKVTLNGVQSNYGSIKVRYRKEGGTYTEWQTILDCKTNNSDEVITPPLLDGALALESNYQVQIIASDSLNDSTPITFFISSDEVFMDRPAGGKSMGLGGYSSGDGNLDVYWKTKARGGISLFDSKGDEIPLEPTLPIPRDQLKGTYDPNNLENGVHIIANNNALKTGDTVIMYNGVLLQMNGDVSGNVKLQLALPTDTNRNPMYRLCWYSNWSDWRSLKL